MRWSVVVLVAGCQEYNISSPPPAFGEPNPPGLLNPVNTDKIVQITTPAVDVLWVIDVSSSMNPEQTDLAENFPAFMDYFLGSGLDYHIGVISTDMDTPSHRGKLREASGNRFITPETANAMGDFATMAQMGDQLSSNEFGLQATYTALEVEADGFNAGFMRDDDTAGIHVNIISDENDYSENVSIGGGIQEFANWFDGLKPTEDADDPTDLNLTTFNSIVRPAGGGGFGINIGTPGLRYMSVTDITGGIKHDISSDDWVSVLERLGIQAAGLKSEYFLSQLPVVSTVAVRVELTDGTVLPFVKGQDYTYEPSRNSITFSEYIPDPLSSVFIDYTVLSSMVEVSEEE